MQGVGAGVAELHGAPAVPPGQARGGVGQGEVLGEDVLPDVGGIGAVAPASPVGALGGQFGQAL